MIFKSLQRECLEFHVFEGKFLETFIVAVVVVTVLCCGSCGCARDDLASLLLGQPRFGNNKCVGLRECRRPVHADVDGCAQCRVQQAIALLCFDSRKRGEAALRPCRRERNCQSNVCKLLQLRRQPCVEAVLADELAHVAGVLAVVERCTDHVILQQLIRIEGGALVTNARPKFCE